MFNPEDENQERARLETMQIMHRLLQQQNMKLEQDVQAKQEAEQKVAERKAITKKKQDRKHRQNKGLEWKKQRYKNRMASRANADKVDYKSPRYRPAHSNYAPSSKTGVPQTGGNQRVIYSNLAREERFAWQKVGDHNPGPADYNPNHSNPMEQYAYVDYVRPYSNNEVYEAAREQNLKPGILKLQDQDQTLHSKRNRLLGKDSDAVSRHQHPHYGQDVQLHNAILQSAGLDCISSKTLLLNDTKNSSKNKSNTHNNNNNTTSTEIVSVRSSRRRNKGLPQQKSLQKSNRNSNTDDSKQNDNDHDHNNKDVRALRRQLDRVNEHLKQAEHDRRSTIQQFQQNIEDLKRRSIMQDSEIRTIGSKLEMHQEALGSLRSTSAELVGTLLDMSPIFTKDNNMQQPFDMIRSKALRVHQAIEDTSERLHARHELPMAASHKSRQSYLDDFTRTPEKSLQNQLMTRNKLMNESPSPPPLPRSASSSQQRYFDDGDGHVPPPPPSFMPPNVLMSAMSTNSSSSSPPKKHLRALSTMSPDQKVDYLYTVCLHHRKKSGNSTEYNGQVIIGVTEFMRILRDAGVLDNKFHFGDAVHLFRKHSIGGGRGNKSKTTINDELVMSQQGFVKALNGVSLAMHPKITDSNERLQRLVSSHLGPFARYLSEHEEHGRMTYEEEQNLDHFLQLQVIEYLIKHQRALQSVFTHAAGFNQKPTVEGGTWIQARTNKWTMTLDQLLDYLKSIRVTPEHVRKPDLNRAMRCATAGNHLLHGETPNELNYAQFLEIMGSLAINCFAPDTSEAHRHLTTPLLRLQFLCMKVDGINVPEALTPSNLHDKRSFKAAEKIMMKEERLQDGDQKASDRKRRVTLSLIGM
jgi:hypothetical protein